MTDLTGQDIGRYRIIEPLGQGGMAKVYRAFDTHLECNVAVKFIRMERLSREDEQRTLKRFEREAKELARLTHPNIVKVTDYGDYNGTPFLVMEYLPGGTLKQFAGKPMPYDQAAHLLAPVARALEYAHEENLIHRDLKPSNILLTARGQPMVTDFGIAKLLDLGGGNTLTGTNMTIGTPEYMAPEQWLNQISAQSDIYSLGVVFYELVTGRKPYTADTPAAIFLKQSTDPLPRPRSFVPDLPEDVEKVLYKALAKKPEDRYASMGEFAIALEGLASIVKSVPKPHMEESETTTMAREEPVAFLDTAQPEIFETEATGKGIAASSPVMVIGQPSEESSIFPPSLPIKSAPGNFSIMRYVWVMIGIIVLVGLIVLVGKGVDNYTTSLAVTQTAQALGIGKTQTSPRDGMVQVYVPPGDFLMGSTDSEILSNSDEKPQHKVYLDAFWIDKYEVTNSQYAKCVADRGTCQLSSCANDKDFNGANHPVVCVDWNQAQAYCLWAGRSLPTEAQWEKAARGTDGRIYPWGYQAPDINRLNYYYNNVRKTTEVGSYPAGASPYGALDMAGNVWEWVADYYDANYYSSQNKWLDPKGPALEQNRVLRGGSWSDGGKSVRSADRGKVIPSYRSNLYGFRCAASP